MKKYAPKHLDKHASFFGFLLQYCQQKETRERTPWGCLLAGLSPGQRLPSLDLKADQRTVGVGFCILVPLSPQTTAMKREKQSSLLDTPNLDQAKHADAFILPQDQVRESG